MLSVKHSFSGEEAGTLPSKKHKRLAPSGYQKRPPHQISQHRAQEVPDGGGWEGE